MSVGSVGRIGRLLGSTSLTSLWSGAAFVLDFANGYYRLGGSGVSDIALLPGFSFNRASLAMMYDKAGRLIYGPHNLLLNSAGTVAQLDASSAVTNAGTTISGYPSSIQFGDNSTQRYAYKQASSLTQGVTYILSAYVQMDDGAAPSIGTTTTTGDFILIVDATIVAGVSVTAIGGGLYRVCAVRTASTGGGSRNNGIIKYTGQSARTFRVTGFQLEAVTYQTTPGPYNPTTTAAYFGPRFVYDPATLAPLGYLPEESRMNLALQSQNLALWSANNSTVSSTSVAGPDGLTSIDKMIPNSGTSGSISLTTATMANSTVYTVSAILNTAGTALDQFTLYCGFDGPFGTDRAGITVTLSGLTMGDYSTGAGAAPTSKNIYPISGTLYRVVFTFTTATVTVSSCVALRYLGGAADGTKGVALSYFQMEPGAFHTSYIRTLGSAVTRAADQMSISGLSISSAATLFVAGLTPRGVSTDARITLGDGTSQHRNYVLYSGTNLGTSVTSTGSTTSAQSVVLAGNVAFKATSTYVDAATNLSGYVNGAGPGSAGTLAVPNTSTILEFGANGGASRFWNAPISSVVVYSPPLSNAAQGSLTT